jgi:hypothetical protein
LKAETTDCWNNFNHNNHGGKNAASCAAIGRKMLASPGVTDMYKILLNTVNPLLVSYTQRVYKNSLATVKRQIKEVENPTPAGVNNVEAADLRNANCVGYLTSDVRVDQREISSTEPNSPIDNNCTEDELHIVMQGRGRDY